MMLQSWNAVASAPLRRRQHFGRHLSSSTKAVSRSWGLAIDIDGVVVRGPNLIPGSDEAVRLLKENSVPHVFLTNGGGVTELQKAQQLDKLVQCGIGEHQMLLSHTPMKKLAERFKDKRVLLVGGKDTVGAAKSYGFDVDGGMAVTSAQLASGVPLYPMAHPGHSHPINPNEPGSPPIEAVLIFFEPVDWGLELQVICDVLAGGAPLGSGKYPDKRQAAEIFVSNPDFIWKAAYDVPRLAQAAFIESLRGIWRRLTGGGELEVQEFGKPHRVQYEAAEAMLRSQPGGESLRRFYGVGDNPAADVRGANGAGTHWRSLLVCTGVYDGGVTSNDSLDPAWRVEQDLLSTVTGLLDASDDEHLRGIE